MKAIVQEELSEDLPKLKKWLTTNVGDLRETMLKSNLEGEDKLANCALGLPYRARRYRLL